MTVSFLYNSEGERTHALVPIEEWENLNGIPSGISEDQVKESIAALEHATQNPSTNISLEDMLKELRAKE